MAEWKSQKYLVSKLHKAASGSRILRKPNIGSFKHMQKGHNSKKSQGVALRFY